jgi:hypothetical protein
VRRALTALGALLVWGVASERAPAEVSTASIAGTIRLEGAPPKIRPTVLAAGHQCAKIAGRNLPQQQLLVAENGALANVLVRLEGEGLAEAAGPPPGEPVVIEQHGCLYRPRVTAGQAGQTLRLVNRDSFLHNTHSDSRIGVDFNIGQPFEGMEYESELTADQELLHLKCSFHPWMRAWVGVVGHRWFAVTGEDGGFELLEVPPGSYELVLWHERSGVLRESVTVVAGGATRAELAYPPAAD